MDDLISRQAVLDYLDKIPSELTSDGRRMVRLRTLKEYISDTLPTVNPPTKIGHWINVNKGKWNTIPAYKCSVCGANADLRDWSGESPFCPWCGAKMVEPQESEEEKEVC